MVKKYVAGIAFVALIALISRGLQMIEVQWLPSAVIEDLVIAILLGMLWRTWRGLNPILAPGVSFCAKQLLETAIVLLGVSINFAEVLHAGFFLLFVIVGVVCLGLFSSTYIGRALGLNTRLATLVAVGNSICGNSAIAAVAPVIHATKEEVASAIALTAVLGVVLVLGLPLLIPLLTLTQYQYGVLAGLSVYAVPQVSAATLPIGRIATDAGTFVKLIRVLTLGPVVAFFSWRTRASHTNKSQTKWTIQGFMPWFVLGFLLMMLLRTINIVPASVAEPLRDISRILTLLSMAALGLGADLRVVRKVGRSVSFAVIGSLLVMIVLSILAIKLTGV